MRYNMTDEELSNIAKEKYTKRYENKKIVDKYEFYQYKDGFNDGFNYANKVHYYPEELPKEKGLYLTFMYFKGDNERPENKNGIRVDSRIFNGEEFEYEPFDTYFKIYAWQNINIPECK